MYVILSSIYKNEEFSLKEDLPIRKPREYQVELPGDLLQIGTLDLRFHTGNTFKGCEASDMVSRFGFSGP